MQTAMMARGARTVIEVCAGVRPGEHVLIVADAGMERIAQAVAAAAYAAGAEPSVVTILPRKADGQEPPRPVAAAMAASDAFVCAVRTSITHTSAVRDAAAVGSRGVMLTQFTEEMLVRGGIEADFEALAPTCRAVADALAGAEEIRLTSPGGTDLTVSARGRRGNALTCLVRPGQFSPVPNVEANVSPVEGSAEGVIVADASIPYVGIGLLSEPVRLEVRGGRIVSISGGEQAAMLERSLAGLGDPLVYNVAEIGVGLNPKCRFCGIMLEDEGVYGSVHIGIGTSITLGGSVKAACHYDLIMTGATIVADGRTMLDKGQPGL
ncbi:MAG: aminopeptidase [Bacillota bacterium]|nr:aminopeptidase [Bacillota bacterium]